MPNWLLRLPPPLDDWFALFHVTSELVARVFVIVLTVALWVYGLGYMGKCFLFGCAGILNNTGWLP